jgi:hypothetical protein
VKVLTANVLFLFFILGEVGSRRWEDRFLGHGLKGPKRRLAAGDV